MNAKEVFENIGVADKNGCKLWLRYRDIKGYGALWSAGRSRRAHRVVWELLRGPIPDGLCVCHRCDNPPCCNVEHLFLTTNAGNTKDRVRKGRSAMGSTYPQAKLDEAEVLFMRCLYWGGTSLAKIAEMYKVSASAADRAIHGRTWAHLPLAVPAGAKRASR